MSLHQADYEKFATTLLAWFGQAVATGQSPQLALQSVALTALMVGVAQLAPATQAPVAATPVAPPQPIAPLVTPAVLPK